MRPWIVAPFLCALGLGVAAMIASSFEAARAQDSPSTQAHGQGDVAEGQSVFKRANCMGCHKWHGGGGGGYGGDALSLRATQLTREQIIETVSCGRPGTGMPYFQRGAYDGDQHPCYGVGRQDLGKTMPVEAPGSFLRAPEIAAVADYVIADIKGKSAPTYADCLAFFGEGSRVCNIYKTAQPAPAPASEGAQPGNQGAGKQED